MIPLALAQPKWQFCWTPRRTRAGERVNIQQDKTRGRAWQEVGSRGPGMGFQPLEPSETTLLAQAQEFIRVSESPRAFLGHSLERAEEGRGVAVKS